MKKHSRYQHNAKTSHLATRLMPVCAAVLAVGAFTQAAAESENACTQSALWSLVACKHDVQDDYSEGRAFCANESDADDVRDCIDEMRAERREESELCKEQRAARLDLCEALGEEPYDPDWEEFAFVEDPRDLDEDEVHTYFPLLVGSTWVYQAEGERITVTVQDALKHIDLSGGDEDEDEDEDEAEDGAPDEDITGGVNCIVVNDLVEEFDEDDLDGVSVDEFIDPDEFEAEAIENTDDWYAQEDGNRNIWYCGEIAVNFETYENDVNQGPEIVDIEGSFKAFRDGAKPGILIPGTPSIGDIYRQEVAIGDAEDAAEVMLTGISSMAEAGETLEGISCENELLLDAEETVEAYCEGGACIVTKDFTPLEPDVLEYKFYAAGVGMILEVDPEEGVCALLVGGTRSL